MQLETLLRAAEQNSRVKGKALEQNKDRIISGVRREFALAARAEWEARLEKAHLRAEDWTDMTEEEMFAVEQVLSCEEEEDPGVYALAQAQQRQPAASTLSGKTAVDSSPPLPSHSINGRNVQAPPPHASHKTATSAAQPQSSSWFGWASKPFQTTIDEVPEELQVSTFTIRYNELSNWSIYYRNLRGARRRTPQSSRKSVRRRRRPLRHNRLHQRPGSQSRAPLSLRPRHRTLSRLLLHPLTAS